MFPSTSVLKDTRRELLQETLYTTSGTFYLNKNLKHAYRVFKDLPKAGSVSENVKNFVRENLKN
jgi:hypothetical protein